MDLSKDGSTLYACSSDGHLAVIQFDVSELGNVAPPDAGRAFLQSWHTQRTPRFHSNHEGQTAGTVGAPNMLVARKGGKARSGLTRESSALLPIPPPGAPQDISIVNGRRRIKPAFLGLGSIVPQPSMTTSVMTSTPYARQNRPVPSLEANNQQPSTSRNAAVFQPQPQNLAQADIDMLDARMQQAPGRGSPHVNFFRTPLQDIGVPSWGTPQDRPVLAGQQASRKRRAAEMDYADENEPLPGLGPYRPSGRTLGGDRNIEPYTGEVVELQPAYIPKTRINTINENLALAVPAVMAYQSKKWDAATDEAEKLEYRNYASHTST
ncbi:HIR complex subunit [Cystobasidiomycetes sp. EMM_F5]